MSPQTPKIKVIGIKKSNIFMIYIFLEFKRSEFITTIKDDDDIAMAAINGTT